MRGRGFTLLEILIACAMVAVLTGALYASLHVAFQARQATQRRLDAARISRVTMDAIARELQGALPPVGILVGAFQGEDNIGAAGRDADSVSFYNTVNVAQRRAGMGDVQYVTLAVIPESNLLVPMVEGNAAPVGSRAGGGRVLVRRVWRNLLAPVAAEPLEQVICRDVISLNLRYFDGAQWLDSWDSTQRDNALPVAVEVTLETAFPEGRSRIGDLEIGHRMVQLVVLPCATPLTEEESEAAAAAGLP